MKKALVQVTSTLSNHTIDLSKTVEVVCPICEKDDSTIKYWINSWKIVKCTYCGFIYVNPRLEKNEIYKIYSSNYFDNKLIGYHHYNENKTLRKRNFQKWINDALPFLEFQSSLKALDIGCAAGYCLEVFQEKGFQPSRY